MECDGFSDDGSRSLPIPHLRSAWAMIVSATHVRSPRRYDCTHVFSKLHGLGFVVQLDAQVRVGFRDTKQVSTESRAKINHEAVPERFEYCGG